MYAKFDYLLKLLNKTKNLIRIEEKENEANVLFFWNVIRTQPLCSIYFVTCSLKVSWRILEGILCHLHDLSIIRHVSTFIPSGVVFAHNCMHPMTQVQLQVKSRSYFTNVFRARLTISIAEVESLYFLVDDEVVAINLIQKLSYFHSLLEKTCHLGMSQKSRSICVDLIYIKNQFTLMFDSCVNFLHFYSISSNRYN